MTATTQTPTLDALLAIADKRGITITDSGPNHVEVAREGYRTIRARRAATEEETLAQALARHLHPAEQPKEWATVQAVLNPSTTADRWLTIAAQLQSN